MIDYRRYTKEEARRDERLCRVMMAAVAAAIAIGAVLHLYCLSTG